MHQPVKTLAICQRLMISEETICLKVLCFLRRNSFHCGFEWNWNDSPQWIINQSVRFTVLILHLGQWGNITIIGSDNVAWPAPSHYVTQCWNIVTGPLETNFSEIIIEIHIFSCIKMLSKITSPKWWSFCLGGDEWRRLIIIHGRWRFGSFSLVRTLP